MPQNLVDPFIPVSRPAKRPVTSTPVRQRPPKAYRPPAGPMLVRRPQPAVSSQPAPPKAPAAAQRPAKVAAMPPKPPAKTAKANEGMSTWVLLGSIIIGSLALFWVMFGQIAIALYGIVALWQRWPSRQTFSIAMFMFVGIVLTSLLPTFRYLAENFAVYAFLLLCIGTISLALETRRDMRQTSMD